MNTFTVQFTADGAQREAKVYADSYHFVFGYPNSVNFYIARSKREYHRGFFGGLKEIWVTDREKVASFNGVTSVTTEPWLVTSTTDYFPNGVSK